MASVLLTAAGSAIGAGIPGIGWLAGPLLGLAGNMLGNSIDASLGIVPRISAPRLQTLRLQDSREGAPIARVYGTMRVAGNIIWSSDLIETRTTTKVGGGKGGSAQATNYRYAVRLAVGICAGPIGGLHRVWADSKLIYDARLDRTYADALRFYPGSSTQSADPLLQAYLGAANTPAFRGTAYVVIDDLHLEHFGNRIPNLTFEIEGISSGFTPACLASTTHTAGIFSGSEDPRRAFATGANSFVVPGMEWHGSGYRFVIEHYSITGGALVQTARVTSAVMTGYGNNSFALSPDGRYLACANAFGSVGEFALYTIRARSFGAISSPVLDMYDSYAYVTCLWVDNEHLAVSAHRNGYPAAILLRRTGGQLASVAPNATPLFADTSLADFWPGTGNCWFLGTACFVCHNGSGTSIGVVRLQMQNGQLRAAPLPKVTLPAGSYKLTALHDDTLLVTTLGSSTTGFATYAVTTGGLVLTRAPATLAIDSTTCEDIMPLGATRFAALGNTGGDYMFAEVTLTDTGFDLSGAPTVLADAPAVGTTITLRRLTGNVALMLHDYGVAVVTARRGDETLASVIADLCEQVGITPPVLDDTSAGSARVPGFALAEGATARRAIELLQQAYAFTLIESDGQLKISAFGVTSPTAIAAADRRASDKETVPSAITHTRVQLQELPTAVQFDYLDAALDYNPASRVASRGAAPHALVLHISAPLALDAATAQNMAEVILARQLAEQDSLRLTTSRAHLALDSGDCLDIDGGIYRITSLAERGGVIELNAVRQIAGTLTASNALTIDGTATELPPQPAQLYVLDLPPLTDAHNQPGLYYAATGPADWRGGIVYRTLPGDAPQEYLRLASIATSGIALDALGDIGPDGQPYYPAHGQTVTVALTHGELASVSENALLNGANVALLGDEIIQFQTATLVADSTYQLSGLLRARRATEWAAASHAIGERFMLLDAISPTFVALPPAARGHSATLQLVTVGHTLAESLQFDATATFETLRPFAPVHLTATRDPLTDDVTLGWTRRARIGGDWADYIDVPLDETAEQYEVIIYDDILPVRSFAPASTSQLYSAADQTTDFGAPPAALTFTVAQISPVNGPGRTASRTVTF